MGGCILKHLILDFAGVSSSGKTTVINDVVGELLKNTERYGNVKIVPSNSRFVAELGSGTSETTSVFSQAYISLTNFVDVMEAASYANIVLTTDLGIRSTAYLMGIEPPIGSIDRTLSEKLISTHKSFSKLICECKLFKILHFYLPPEIPLVADGIRSENPMYHKKIDGYIKDIYKSVDITPFTLRGSEKVRRDYVMCLLNKYCY